LSAACSQQSPFLSPVGFHTRISESAAFHREDVVRQAGPPLVSNVKRMGRQIDIAMDGTDEAANLRR